MPDMATAAAAAAAWQSGMLWRGRGSCFHVATPRAGPALEVVRLALSGETAEAHQRPRSFDLMHPSSAKKMGNHEPEKAQAQRMALQERNRDPERRLTLERVRELFELGSLYTHERNRAGVTVLRRLTADDLATPLEEGWYVRCFVSPKRFPVRLGPSNLVFENDDMVVVDKPRGLPSVSTVDNFVENAIYQTSKLIQQPLWPLHRLDTPTTGLLVFGKSSEVASRLGAVWREGTIRKHYAMLAEAPPPPPSQDADATAAAPPAPLPPPGTKVTHWMNLSTHHSPKPIGLAPCEAEGLTKEASLVIEDWTLVRPRQAVCKVRLLTGRTHQIRAQMSLLGWPLMGDIMYRPGFDKDAALREGLPIFDPDLRLRCYRMTFDFDGETFDLRVPEDAGLVASGEAK